MLVPMAMVVVLGWEWCASFLWTRGMSLKGTSGCLCFKLRCELVDGQVVLVISCKLYKCFGHSV